MINGINRNSNATAAEVITPLVPENNRAKTKASEASCVSGFLINIEEILVRHVMNEIVKLNLCSLIIRRW